MVTMLIIDDDQDVLEVATTIISDLFPNLDLLAASTLQEVKTHAHKADCILSDLYVPYRKELNELLHEWGQYKPVGRMSGYSDVPECLNKPFRESDVKKFVQSLIDRAAVGRGDIAC